MHSSGAHPDIQVVIVNYNAGEALLRCVQSVLDQNLPVRITVFDNASADSSMASLECRPDLLDKVVITKSAENLGFARAVNAAVNAAVRGLADDSAGAGASGKPFLLILNPDCEMLPGSLEALCTALEQDSAAALAGPMVVDGEGLPMRGTLRRFPRPGSALLTFSGLWRLARWIPAFAGVEKAQQLPADTVPAEAVSGACMLLRTAQFLGVGCMDGDYGLHCEDLDLMYRLRQQGFHCLFVPSARVYHAQGVSSASRPAWVHWQKHRGMQRFFQKFQAEQYVFPMRWLVISGIWLRFAVTLPLVLMRS